LRDKIFDNNFLNIAVKIFDKNISKETKKFEPKPHKEIYEMGNM